MLIGAVVAGVAVWLATSPSSTSSGSAATASPTTTHAASGPTPVSAASTSTRGIQGNSINVVFPVVSLNSLAGQEGFAADPEYGEQTKAIQFYVKQINDSGGINGRHINPIITNYDPTSETAMRALCKTWTEGSPAAFAVLDGIGAWTGDNQLCITQEGQTPFIGGWSTVTNWTNQGSPYLWWTGPDDSVILQAVVDWGLSAHLLGGSRVVGVIAGDRASDQLALNDYLLPDLHRAGVTPVVETIASDPTESATTNSQAPLVIQQLRSAGVDSVIPLIPFNVFYPVLQAETSQQYYPRLLLSDYEESIESALGLIPIPYEKALDGQEGLTTQTLGGSTTPSNYTGPKGYDPGVKACWTPWHKAYPQIPSGATTDYLEEQGPGRPLVRDDHPLRRGREERRPGPQPAHLRHRALEDHRLPGHLDADPQLRTRQTLRADPLQDRPSAQQRPPELAVPADVAKQGPGNLLDQRDAIPATAEQHRLRRRAPVSSRGPNPARRRGGGGSRASPRPAGSGRARSRRPAPTPR